MTMTDSGSAVRIKIVCRYVNSSFIAQEKRREQKEKTIDKLWDIQRRAELNVCKLFIVSTKIKET